MYSTTNLCQLILWLTHTSNEFGSNKKERERKSRYSRVSEIAAAVDNAVPDVGLAGVRVQAPLLLLASDLLGDKVLQRRCDLGRPLERPTDDICKDAIDAA